MTIKLLMVATYLGALLLIGILASRRMKNVRDYYAGGKRLGFLSVAFSARATGESAWLLLGLTGMGAAVGAQAFWVVLGEILGVSGAWILMSRRFKRLTDRYDSITVPDYLESRFRDSGHLLRLVSAAALVIFVTIYVSAQIDATGTAFEGFLGWNYFAGAAFGFIVVMAYIVSGGFVAVVWSDVLQGMMMVLGLVVLPIVGLVVAGGWTPVAEGLRAQDPGLLSPWGPGGWDSMTVFKTLSFALIGLGFLGSPQIFVRFLSLRSTDEIRRGTVVALLWTFMADAGAVLTGMVGRHLLMGGGGDESVDAVLGASAQNVLPLLSEHLLPALLVGLIIAIVLSAIMSTVDSLLVVASSAVVRDYYQKMRNPDLPDDSLVGLSRIATVITAIAALAVAMAVAMTTPNRTIFWFVVFGWSGIAATFCPTMILSLFWRGFTGRGALAAMVCGFLSVPIFKFAVPRIDGPIGEAFGTLEELAPAFAVSFIVGVIVSLLDGAGRARIIDAATDDLRFASGDDDGSASTNQLRTLRFGSLDEVLADAEAMPGAAARTGGNWTASQIVDHIADAIDASIDGFPMLAPRHVRVVARRMRDKVLREGLRPGLQVSGKMQDMMPSAECTWDEAIDHLRRAIARVDQETMAAEHPYLGNFTHDEWKQLHCRHAELHFGFVDGPGAR